MSVELIERAKSGFLGLGGNPARVRVSYEAPEEAEESAPAPSGTSCCSALRRGSGIFRRNCARPEKRRVHRCGR